MWYDAEHAGGMANGGAGVCGMGNGHNMESVSWLWPCSKGLGTAFWHRVHGGTWHTDVQYRGCMVQGLAKAWGAPSSCGHIACGMALGCGRVCVGGVVCEGVVGSAGNGVCRAVEIGGVRSTLWTCGEGHSTQLQCVMQEASVRGAPHPTALCCS